MKLKKVLFVDLAYPFGGIETYLVSLAQILAGEIEMFALCVTRVWLHRSKRKTFELSR